MLSPIKTASVASYTLSGVNDKAAGVRRDKDTVLVTMPVVSPGYDSSAMIYVDKPFQLKSFAHNQWVSGPANMFLPLIVQSLINTKRFHAVVAVPFSGVPDFRLDTYILRMQQEFLVKPSRVRITMGAQLVDNHTNKIIATRRFEVVERTKADTPYEGVIATNLATGKMLEKIALFAARAA